MIHERTITAGLAELLGSTEGNGRGDGEEDGGEAHVENDNKRVR